MMGALMSIDMLSLSFLKIILFFWFNKEVKGKCLHGLQQTEDVNALEFSWGVATYTCNVYTDQLACPILNHRKK